MLRAIAFLLLIVSGAQAQAQVFTVTSITPADVSLGAKVSPASGTTNYTTAPAAGVLVTITCTNGTVNNSCGNKASNSPTATITITPAAQVTGRTAALKNFTIAAGTGTPSSTGGTNTGLTFTLTSATFGNASTRTFRMGADFTVTSTGDSGTATAGYTIMAKGTGNPGGSSLNRTFSATVTRPFSVVSDGNTLAFGTVAKASNGATINVAISAADGSRTITAPYVGTGTSGRATFTLKGENGKAYSVSFLNSSTITMTRTLGGSIPVSLTLSDTSGAFNNGSAATDASKVIGVGGSISVTKDTIPGNYVGSFTVVAQYN